MIPCSTLSHDQQQPSQQKRKEDVKETKKKVSSKNQNSNKKRNNIKVTMKTFVRQNVMKETKNPHDNPHVDDELGKKKKVTSPVTQNLKNQSCSLSKNHHPLLPDHHTGLQDLMTPSLSFASRCDCDSVDFIRNRILELDSATDEQDNDLKKKDYDARDIDHFIVSTDAHILRYMDRFRPEDLKRQLNPKEVEKVIAMISDTLEWRKGNTLSSLTPLSFPIEFYSVGGLFVYTQDKYDNLLLVFRLKMYQKIPELQEGMELFTTYKMFEAHNICVDESNSFQGWCLIFDMTDVTMAQCDLPQLFWLINTFLSYFPKTLRQAYVYNVAWIFKKLANFMMNFLPKEYQEIVKFLSGEEILQHFDRDKLPDYMGGTCDLNYRSIPAGARPVEDIAYEKYRMPLEECLRIKKHFDKFLPEEYRVVKTAKE